MVHNNTSLMVSANEAERVDDEAKRRLLAAKKLSLVVDLDQTIIHATVDPTVADWQRDEQNPNHEAVKDVRSFLLKDEGVGKGGLGCWYYIKLRPGLREFLENVSKIYELHIYTMGTRQYAKNIADIIDPDRKIFGDRILSRDESGSMTAKNLQRLFPVDTKMVVIIDDRGDVWKWSPNLIKVTPYDFFVGIGDINSSFLPKKPELRTTHKLATDASSKTSAERRSEAADDAEANGTGEAESAAVHGQETKSPIDLQSSPLDHLVAMSGGNGTVNRDEQTSSQDEALTVQLEEKPLLQKQKQLEADDAAAAEANVGMEESSSSGPEAPKDLERPKHSLLHDNDRELLQLEKSLRSVHSAFYHSWGQSLAAAQGGRLGKLRGAQKQKSPTDKSDLDLVPDIKTILPSVKSKVLGGTVLVLSGIVPLGMDVASTDIAILAKSFGATISTDVNRTTTHVVAARNRTQKVRAAIRRGRGRIRIVSPSWLLESINSWERKDEYEYLLEVEDGRDGTYREDDALSESESDISGAEGEVSDAESVRSRQRPSLSISVKPPVSQDDDNGDDDGIDAEDLIPSESNVDEQSPVGGSNEDWSAMNEELAEFLGSEDDLDENDDTNESDASSTSRLSAAQRGRKRARGDEDDSDTGSDRSSRRYGKKYAGRRKLALTSLSQSAVAGDQTDSPAPIGAEGGDEDPNNDEEPKEGDGWSDFEEEDFDAELERAGSEEHDGGVEEQH